MSRPWSAARAFAVSISAGARSIPVTSAPAAAARSVTPPVPQAMSSQPLPVAADAPARGISFRPIRRFPQGFTGVPAIVELAALLEAMQELGGRAAEINPVIPAELVIDHSVQVDEFATRFAFGRNVELEFER